MSKGREKEQHTHTQIYITKLVVFRELAKQVEAL